MRWVHSICNPTFVFEGTYGNVGALESLARVSKNAKLRIIEVKDADHFNLLVPTHRLIAAKILQDTGPTCRLAISDEEVNRAFSKR